MSVLQVVVIMGILNWLSIVLVIWIIARSKPKKSNNILAISCDEARGIARRLSEGSERASDRSDKVFVDAYQKGSDKMVRFEICGDMHTSSHHRE